jgi:hypothetical protein
VWFFVLDTIQGRPFYTRTVLGTALFRRGAGLASLEKRIANISTFRRRSPPSWPPSL